MIANAIVQGQDVTYVGTSASDDADIALGVLVGIYITSYTDLALAVTRCTCLEVYQYSLFQLIIFLFFVPTLLH